jgi:hypothetical protein
MDAFSSVLRGARCHQSATRKGRQRGRLGLSSQVRHHANRPSYCMHTASMPTVQPRATKLKDAPRIVPYIDEAIPVPCLSSFIIDHGSWYGSMYCTDCRVRGETHANRNRGRGAKRRRGITPDAALRSTVDPLAPVVPGSLA